jgi:DNA-binding protein H-NS
MDISNLSIEEKIELFNQLKDAKIEAEYRKAGKKKVAELLREKKQKIAEIEKTYTAIISTTRNQYGLDDGTDEAEEAADDGNQSEDKRKGKKPIKYRDPNNSKNTWTGQGKLPNWLSTELKNWGITKEQFITLSTDNEKLFENVKNYHLPSEGA